MRGLIIVGGRGSRTIGQERIRDNANKPIIVGDRNRVALRAIELAVGDDIDPEKFGDVIRAVPAPRRQMRVKIGARGAPKRMDNVAREIGVSQHTLGVSLRAEDGSEPHYSRLGRHAFAFAKGKTRTGFQ